jgi:flagella basal body P-ring formation protein FlgA
MKTSSLLQLLEDHKVIIPIIQRDYAQGRTMGKVPKIRERFLSEIYSNLTNNDSKPLELDFIYGYTNIEENNKGEQLSFFTPLDGQQRLTTLYLLHWYLASRENELWNLKDLLIKFTYATRNSSRMFCAKLVHFSPKSWNGSLAETIIEQPWFFSAWKNDPTIASMLVMLDAIHQKFKGTTNLLMKLIGDKPKIVFHLLPMDKLGLPDDLYIKMNSRGKELTDFEHFKSQFSDILPSKHAKIFNDNIDIAWSDLFWSLFKDEPNKDIAKLVDSGFLSFFWFLADILAIKNKINRKGLDNGELIVKLFKENEANIEFLFSYLNLFTEIHSKKEKYFESLFYINEYENNKCKLFFQNAQINLFKKCCETYGYDEKSNSFSIGEQLMFYACILHKQNNNENFNLNIRKIRNILSSSEFQLRKENLPSLYNDIEALVLNRELSDDSKLSKTQIEEETIKQELLQLNPELSETIFKLEDHNLLRGTISIFDIDENITSYAVTFKNIFKSDCNYFNISQAMLTLGNYSQKHGRLRRFGNATDSTWRELFTPNEYRKNFKKTKAILKEYLSLYNNYEFSDDNAIITSFNNDFDVELAKPKNWRYYYIRYDNFKQKEGKNTDGFYFWDDISKKPFECNMMNKKQFNGWNWNPYLLELNYINKKCNLENYGNDLQFTHKDIILLISMDNDSFIFETQVEDDLSNQFLEELINNQKLKHNGRICVKQNEEGHDIMDRIQLCNNFLLDLESLINNNKLVKTI